MLVDLPSSSAPQNAPQSDSDDGEGSIFRGSVKQMTEENADQDKDFEILHGEPLTDRKSTFQAHAAEVCSIKEVSDGCLVC